jgi:hypothetical protein
MDLSMPAYGAKPRPLGNKLDSNFINLFKNQGNDGFTLNRSPIIEIKNPSNSKI